jgi:pyrimidine operon attenuation protein / uracil phosphoribosyltransferase
MALTANNCIINKNQAQQIIQRLALEIAEKLSNDKPLVFVGIAQNGSLLAQSIAYQLQIHNIPTEIFTLDINKQEPSTRISISNPQGLQGANIILVDDVVNSGITMAYSLAFLLQKQPLAVYTCALVERSYKKFPIMVHFTGYSMATSPQNHITVQFVDNQIEGAFLE